MTGQWVGYIRVSSTDQNPERQLEGIALDRVFTDKATAKDTDRPQLKELLSFVREGDTSWCTVWIAWPGTWKICENSSSTRPNAGCGWSS